MSRTISIRSFIGAIDYQESLDFYRSLGFSDVETGPTMSYIRISDQHGFYLQDAYVKDWVDNSMLFLEVENLDEYHQHVIQLDLSSKYEKVRLSEIVSNSWGREFFLHDPSGVLWHIGEFV